VIVDTNALMAISGLKVDVFHELDKCLDINYEVFVLSGTVMELEKIINEQKGKHKRDAKLALQILKHKEDRSEICIIVEEKPDLSVDDNLVLESKRGALVLTQDKELKSRLAKPYLTIRQKKKVVVVS
jgi:rRNA-processing protein FCF1